jgi:hypothetical protein
MQAHRSGRARQSLAFRPAAMTRFARPDVIWRSDAQSRPQRALPCGSGRNVKRCCGQQRGPSEDDLARAHIAILAREAAPDMPTRRQRPQRPLGGTFRSSGRRHLAARRAAQAHHSRPATPARGARRPRPRLGMARPGRHRHTDRYPPTARGTRSRAVALRDQDPIDREQAAAADLESRFTRVIAASLLEAVALSGGGPTPPAASNRRRNRRLTLPFIRGK